MRLSRPGTIDKATRRVRHDQRDGFAGVSLGQCGCREQGAQQGGGCAGKRMGHAGALISGGADTADAKLAVMEECGFTITRNPSEMARLLKALL